MPRPRPCKPHFGLGQNDQVTPWEPDAVRDDAVRREVSTRDVPAVDEAPADDTARTIADDTPLATATPAREGAPPKIKTPMRPQMATKPTVDARQRDANNVSRAESTMREVTDTPRNPEDENLGDNRAHADLWVELTRWLPRAASSDRA